MVLLNPSINTLLLGILNAAFLAKGFLCCEMMVNESFLAYRTLEKHQQSTLLEFDIPPTFLRPLRNISFLLTGMLTASLIAMHTLDPSDIFSAKALQGWLFVGLVECGRWFLILFLVNYLYYNVSNCSSC